mmetsp:Transcript_69120/g.192391  ORF Transcript_69120/g.192391 Transcript_69120/m.192391 type:complete len:325 (-) Transcript_69120:67-1041(-)
MMSLSHAEMPTGALLGDALSGVSPAETRRRPVFEDGALPTLFPHPLIVKNTFLDVDDGAFERNARRTKTEGAKPGSPQSLGLYESTSSGEVRSAGASSAESIGLAIEDAHVTPAAVPAKRADQESDGASETRGPSGCHSREAAASQEASEASLSGSALEAMRVNGPAGPPLEPRSASPSCVANADSIARQTMFKWTVDAKKLRSNDRSMVSRPFLLSVGPDPTCPSCKLMLYARTSASLRAGQSFKSSNGQGSVQLKCEQDVGSGGKVRMRFSIGGGRVNKLSKLVEHDFSRSASCVSSNWDFASAVDHASQTLAVSVEVLAES